MKSKLLNIFFVVMGRFARFYLNKKKVLVVGISWSVGKTSARMAISASLQKLLPNQKIYTSPHNFNWELGLSLSILKIQDYTPTIAWILKVLLQWIKKLIFEQPDYDIIVLEYGIDHIGEMDFMLRIAKPDFWVLTYIDKVHAQQLGSPDIIAEQKYKMIFASKKAVFLNYEDVYQKTANVAVDKFLFLTREKKYLPEAEVDIWFDNYQITKDFEASADVFIKTHKVKTTTNYLGKEVFAYIGVGITIADIISYQHSQQSILNNLKNLDISLQMLGGRATIFKGINDSVIVDSSYNASPASMQKMIEFTKSLRDNLFKNYKTILVLGDMRELWEFAEQEHRKMAGLASQVADIMLVVGPNMNKYFLDELTKLWFTNDLQKGKFAQGFKNSKELGIWLREFLKKSRDKYLILFKGSQNTIFLEEAIKYVLANPEDKDKLIRGDELWLQKKENFFSSQW